VSAVDGLRQPRPFALPLGRLPGTDLRRFSNRVEQHIAKQAVAKGAIAILGQHAINHLNVPVFITSDYLADLTKIAVSHRQKMNLKILIVN
jgi:UDP-N-acetylmuramyl pentapeptide synthase